MGTKRSKIKQQQPGSKRRRRDLPKKLWVEDCLELLPPPRRGTGPEETPETTETTSGNGNSQLWVKITAKVLVPEADDQHRSPVKEVPEPEFRGPRGAWLIETVEIPPTENEDLDIAKSATVSEKNIFIQRLAADIPKMPKTPLKHLPKGDCGDGIQNPHKHVPDKFWAQRRRLFSKFDDGIQMIDTESWYSVTPELIARHIASRLCEKTSIVANNNKQRIIVLDAFCGIGGNSIAFGLHLQVELVVCVDNDKSKLEAAANNCRVYGVPCQKVLFVHGDVCDLLLHYKNGSLTRPTKDSEDSTAEIHDYRCGGFELLPSRLDSVFLSPPWGGVDYMEHGSRHFNLDCIKVSSAVSGKELLHRALKALRRPDIAMFLPRNLNGLMVAENCFELGVRGTIEVERNYVLHKLKTITVYIAPLD